MPTPDQNAHERPPEPGGEGAGRAELGAPVEATTDEPAAASSTGAAEHTRRIWSALRQFDSELPGNCIQFAILVVLGVTLALSFQFTRDQIARNTAISTLEIRGLLRQSALQSVEQFYTKEQRDFLGKFECGRTPAAEDRWTRERAYDLHVYFSHFEYVFDALNLGLIDAADWQHACSDLAASLDHCLFRRYWTSMYDAKPVFRAEVERCAPQSQQ